MTPSKQNPKHISAVGPVPSEWNVIRAKFLYKERKELSLSGEEELLSASHISGITKRSEKDVGMFLAESLEGYKRVYGGDVAVNTMWAWMGALGVSPLEGVISPSYGVYMPNREVRDQRFYDYLFRSRPFVAEINRRSKGVWSSRLRLYPDDFLCLRLPCPPLHTQKLIADFLDAKTSRIDQLIDKKRQFLLAVSSRIETLVDQAISGPDVPRIRFQNVAQRVQRSVLLSNHEELVRLGLYNRGRGLFKKAAADEEGMGDSDFFFVKAGDLILSGQFAWEGAVALASAGEAGCVVSHRYPVYSGTKRATTAYLLAFFRTKTGDFILNEASRGSAGRNRPLNVNRLEKEKIPIPSAALQARISEMVSSEMEIRRKMQTSIDLLQEHRSALITAAVTGQIDVAIWGKRGTTDRQLDAIEADMAVAAQLERQQVRA